MKPLLRSSTMLLALCASRVAAEAGIAGPSSLWAAPPAAQPEAQLPGDRGRDPWVFRCLFEDRSRMLVIAPRPKLWFAYNISGGSVYKAWQGDMDYRGKVWDFSQNSSRAKGHSLLSWSNDLAHLADKPGPPSKGWTADGVEYKDGWSFTGPDATLTSPAFDAANWTRLFIAYEELSRKGPIRVEVSTNGGQSWDAQWFDSTTHGSRNDEWQWGFKQIAVPPTASMRIRFRQLDPAFAKRLRNIRVFGDHVAWWTDHDGNVAPASVTWVGHELIKQTEGVVLRFKVGDTDQTVEINESLDASTESGTVHLVERLTVGDLPKGASFTGLRLILPDLARGGKRGCSVASALQEWKGAQAMFIDHPGTYELTSSFPGKEASR